MSRYLPKPLLQLYHLLLAALAVLWYYHPSKKLIVIGVTGTKGKTTTALFMHAALSAAGKKTGLISTIEMRIGDKVSPNTMHMTMPGRGYMQKKIHEMVLQGCTHVIIETSSEGISQFRTLGIHYDALVFTNLSPEHLVTHKTFERYRETKGSVFKKLAKAGTKKLNGKGIQKIALINADDKHAEYFYNSAKSKNVKRIRFGLSGKAEIQAMGIEKKEQGSTFTLNNEQYQVPFPGPITIQNAIPAIVLAKEYGKAKAESINKAFAKIQNPGRLEEFKKELPFRVFCDYAHEPLSIQSVYEALKTYTKENGRVIMVVGALGGSRWKYNAEQIGETAAKHADTTIITNIEPYFDDPQEIANAVAKGAKKIQGAQWLVELDRRKAIQKALSTAKKGDVVIITGKGAETTMPTKGEDIPWDERAIIQEELEKIKNTTPK